MATLNAVLVVALQPVATHVLARFDQTAVYVAVSMVTALSIVPRPGPRAMGFRRHRRLVGL
jgi:hypothetical protein